MKRDIIQKGKVTNTKGIQKNVVSTFFLQMGKENNANIFIKRKKILSKRKKLVNMLIYRLLKYPNTEIFKKTFKKLI